jgi:hypothetical protein
MVSVVEASVAEVTSQAGWAALTSVGPILPPVVDVLVAQWAARALQAARGMAVPGGMVTVVLGMVTIGMAMITITSFTTTFTIASTTTL